MIKILSQTAFVGNDWGDIPKDLKEIDSKKIMH